jgi:hypothetical protein
MRLEWWKSGALSTSHNMENGTHGPAIGSPGAGSFSRQYLGGKTSPRTQRRELDAACGVTPDHTDTVSPGYRGKQAKVSISKGGGCLVSASKSAKAVPQRSGAVAFVFVYI